MRRVTTIGKHFLSYNEQLSVVDLRFERLTRVDDAFLLGCTSLTAVDFSRFAQVTAITTARGYGR